MVSESEGKPKVTLHLPKDLKFTKDSICVYIRIYFLIYTVSEHRTACLLVHIQKSLVTHVFLSDNPKPTQEKAGVGEQGVWLTFNAPVHLGTSGNHLEGP